MITNLHDHSRLARASPSTSSGILYNNPQTRNTLAIGRHTWHMIYLFAYHLVYIHICLTPQTRNRLVDCRHTCRTLVCTTLQTRNRLAGGRQDCLCSSCIWSGILVCTNSQTCKACGPAQDLRMGLQYLSVSIWHTCVRIHNLARWGNVYGLLYLSVDLAYCTNSQTRTRLADGVAMIVYVELAYLCAYAQPCTPATHVWIAVFVC